MQHTKQEKPTTEGLLNNPFGEMFAHNANLWFTTHAEMLANMDALTQAWLASRREGVGSMREAIQQMTETRDATDMLRVQQQWLSDACRRATDDVTRFTTGLSSITAKATGDFEQAARKVGVPLYVVGEEMRQAAGDKPPARKSKH
jgi:hypothetical protein